MTYQEAKVVAEKNGLDLRKFFICLSWLEPRGEAAKNPIQVEIFRQMSNGEFHLRNGIIVMNDRTHPLRFQPNEYYQAA